MDWKVGLVPVLSLLVWMSNALASGTRWSEQYHVPAQQGVPASASGSHSGQSGLCVPGSSVQILSAGSWYAGRVLNGPGHDGTCQVSYDGYGSNWDEWVSQSRLRPGRGTGGPSAASGAGSASTSSSGSSSAATSSGADTSAKNALPAGTYNCYTFDAGNLNYTYTDVVIRSNAHYAVGAKAGQYVSSGGGSLTFKSGPLKDVKASYSVKSGNVFELLLVFNNDNRASMVCPRARR